MFSTLFSYGPFPYYIALVILFMLGTVFGTWAEDLRRRIMHAAYCDKVDKLRDTPGTHFDPAEPLMRFAPWAGAMIAGMLLAYLFYWFIGWLGV